MEDDDFSELCSFNPNKYIKTYSKPNRKIHNPNNRYDNVDTAKQEEKKNPLTSKNAVKYLLEGTLKTKVCRYCLNEADSLSGLDENLQLAREGNLYKVTIRDMIASFHPFKTVDDPNFPIKICDKCLEHTIISYKFTQQCEQAERALRNCFDDMYEKLEKLDSLERPKKRGRQKLNPNYNRLHAEHANVIDYAEPIINLIHTASESLSVESPIKEFECLKCSQVLPNIEILLNHEKSHPKAMWYNCRLCGKSFPKRNHLKKHMKMHLYDKPITAVETDFTCKKCGIISKNYSDYLQHLEKHKFKVLMEHLIEGKMDKICSVCLDRKSNMTELENMVCLHGGCPELSGDKSLYNILATTLPDMSLFHNYTGTKICANCLNFAITSYIFINQFHFVRNRLATCVSIMLDNLNEVVSLHSNIFIEISEKAIMQIEQQYEENLLIDEHDYVDESKLKIEVLEDEFRVKTDNEESESEKDNLKMIIEDVNTLTKINMDLVNGFQNNSIDNVSEFLTFKKKKPKRRPVEKYTCPLCMKHFISDYFLKRHVVKHINKKVECEQCCIQFKSKFYLYEHTKMAHSLKQNKFLSCRTCGRTYLDKKKLISHEKHHKTKRCQLCDKIFASQKYYDSHMQRHAIKLRKLTLQKDHNCSFCEKLCSNSNELSLHVNRVHLEIKPFACDMCDRKFYTEYSLNCHKKIHSLSTKEICQFCSKILRSRKQLVNHVRKHIGAKPYKCKICGQAFHLQSQTREHMIKCHGGRFFCRFCKTVFANKFGRKEHVLRAHNVL